MEYSTFEDLKTETKKLLSDNVNDRSFEVKITTLSDNFDLGLVDTFKTELAKMKNDILSDPSFQNTSTDLKDNESLKHYFILFFTLFTKYRRSKYSILNDFYHQFYLDALKCFEISQFIHWLAAFSADQTSNTLLTYRRELKKMIDNPLFSNHYGILNFYIEVTCLYFENQLDLKDTPETIALLSALLSKIESMSQQEPHSKYFLNQGRLLILLKRYEEGISCIDQAIHLVRLSFERQTILVEYQQYIAKAAMIKTYDLNKEKTDELNHVKIDNFKALTVMTTILGFLLGSINIFTNLITPAAIAAMMVCYFSLMLVLLSVCLFGLNLLANQKNKKYFQYDLGIFLSGVALFIVGILCAVYLT